MNDKILFLDFDGVLFDTIMEVYLVNRCHFNRIDCLQPVNQDEFEHFKKYKYLVYNIWMFYYYNPIIFNFKNGDEIVRRYYSALENRDLKAEEQFCSELLKIRENLVQNHHEFWKNLEVPYEFFYEIKKLYEEKNIDIVIVSKKNKLSILERFESYGFKLPSEKVFAREALKNYPSKNDFILDYMNRNSKKSAIFVDDNINNLKNIDDPKINTILALWGNNAPDDVGLNQAEASDKIKAFFS